MRRPAALVPVVAASLALGFAPTEVAAPDAHTPGPAVFEPAGAMDHDCLQPVPAAVSANGLLGGDDVHLHVRLVLDLAESRALDATRDDPTTSSNERQAAINAFGRKVARDYLAAGKQSYAEIGITLDYASFDVLRAPDLRSGKRAATMEGRTAIELAKKQYGGTRPPGTDVVYVLTDRDLTTGGDPALAGLADCIGGVHHATTAFATGELDRDPTVDLVLTEAYVEFTAKVAAHEVGHLLGAHHHYQACGPYAVTNHLDGHGLGGCTLMTNFVDLVTFPLSPTNQAVVRGHAEAHAAGNDP